MDLAGLSTDGGLSLPESVAERPWNGGQTLRAIVTQLLIDIAEDRQDYRIVKMIAIEERESRSHLSTSLGCSSTR